MENIIFTIVNFWEEFAGNFGKTDYRTSTKDRYHFIADLGLYCGRCFQFGNHKLGKQFAIFSLKEVLSCPTCFLYGCSGDCYALKASRQYKSAKNHRLFMSYMAINHLDVLEAWIIQDLKKRPKAIKYVRIHEAGDFINQDYVDMWVRVAAAFPELTFYFYTKTFCLFDFSGFGPNVAKNDSVLPGNKKNYGSVEYIQQLKKENPEKHCHICSYGFENEKECGIKCLFCMTPDKTGRVKNPLFLDHYNN